MKSKGDMIGLPNNNNIEGKIDLLRNVNTVEIDSTVPGSTTVDVQASIWICFQDWKRKRAQAEG